jgi:hypothetical protein
MNLAFHFLHIYRLDFHLKKIFLPSISEKILWSNKFLKVPPCRDYFFWKSRWPLLLMKLWTRLFMRPDVHLGLCLSCPSNKSHICLSRKYSSISKYIWAYSSIFEVFKRIFKKHVQYIRHLKDKWTCPSVRLFYLGCPISSKYPIWQP